MRAIVDSWQRFVRTIRSGERLPFCEHWAAYRRGNPGGALRAAWEPDASVVEQSNLYQLQVELGLDAYEGVQRFSVEQREAFWTRALDRLGIVFERKPDRILDLDGGVKQPPWLPGARLEITRSCFTAPSDETAIVFGREDGSIETLTYAELERQVDRFALGLTRRGLNAGAPCVRIVAACPARQAMLRSFSDFYISRRRVLWELWETRRVFQAARWNREAISKALWKTWKVARTGTKLERRGKRRIDLYEKVRDAAAMFAAPPWVVVVDAEGLRDGDIAWDDLLASEAGDVDFTASPIT